MQSTVNTKMISNEHGRKKDKELARQKRAEERAEERRLKKSS